MFDDKVEITYPSSLSYSSTEGCNTIGKINSICNPTVANVFFRLKLIENFGFSTRRINNSYKDSLVKPEFTVFENSIKIVLPTLTQKTLATKNEQVILDLMCHQQHRCRTLPEWIIALFPFWRSCLKQVGDQLLHILIGLPNGL